MLFLQDKLKMLRSVIYYLDNTKQFENIKQLVNDNKNRSVASVCHIYNFSIDVDLRHIFEEDADLGNQILLEPLDSVYHFQEVVYHFCLSHKLLTKEIALSQIYIQLRVTTFPTCGIGYQISRFSDLTKFVNHQGYTRLVGIAIGISAVAKYTQSTKYVCPQDSCTGHDGNHYIRIHVPGASETNTIRNDFTCTFCGEILEEVKSMRILSDKMLVEVVPIKQQSHVYKEVMSPCCFQAIPVYIRDELVNSIEPGKAYEIVGLCRTDFLGIDISITLEANNIKQISSPCLPQLAVLPLVFQQLFDQCLGSPWSFPLHVAHLFGEQIVPTGLMIKLRLLLLIGLVLNPQMYRLHILAVGMETELAQSLLKFAQQFCVRSSQAAVTTPLSGKVVLDKLHWAPYFIECGSLLLSCGGVCMLGDLGGWKKQRREQLQAVVTENKVVLDLAHKTSGALSQQLKFALEAHLWGVYDPTATARCTANQGEDLFSGCNTGDLSKGLLNAFSYVCFLDAGDFVTKQEVVAETTCHILSSHLKLECSKSQRCTVEDFEHYLEVCRQTEVKMLPQAESLLQSYYTASRSARSSGLSGSEVPPSAILTLTALAIGFSKLKLQASITVNDALMAVFLYEETLAARYGMSLLNVQPQPHVSASRIQSFLGKQNDQAMQSFYVQLLRFCACAKTKGLADGEE